MIFAFLDRSGQNKGRFLLCVFHKNEFLIEFWSKKGEKRRFFFCESVEGVWLGCTARRVHLQKRKGIFEAPRIRTQDL